MPTAIELIAAERQRQIDDEGWTSEHDDAHTDASLAAAAACYALTGTGVIIESLIAGDMWPWRESDWKPKDRVSNLSRAGALIAAELDRELRKKTGGT